jgi:hypothetical protein
MPNVMMVKNPLARSAMRMVPIRGPIWSLRLMHNPDSSA